MRYLKLYESFEDIHEICKKFKIENYTINDDGSIDVDGDVKLLGLELTELPLKFGYINGDFICSSNNLHNLNGCPTRVNGNFACSHNKLTSLSGSPTHVNGNFWCKYNNISSLYECRNISVGKIFDFTGNKITSFEYLPIGNCFGNSGRESIYFYCDKNPIENIWKLFKSLNYIEFFNDCDIIRDDYIVLERLNFFLKTIEKPPVESVYGYKNLL